MVKIELKGVTIFPAVGEFNRFWCFWSDLRHLQMKQRWFEVAIRWVIKRQTAAIIHASKSIKWAVAPPFNFAVDVAQLKKLEDKVNIIKSNAIHTTIHSYFSQWSLEEASMKVMLLAAIRKGKYQRNLCFSRTEISMVFFTSEKLNSVEQNQK